jgi:YfiH family protein
MESSMILKEKDGVKFMTIPSFEQAGGVICAFSTRIGGVSPKPFDTLNFSRKREQSDANFTENFIRFAYAVGFDENKAVGINYAHSPDVYHVHMEDAGRGIFGEPLPEFCDGLYTDEIGLPILSFHADCVPLFFYDPKRRAVAVCHAGWRGAAAHMVQNTVDSLVAIGCKEIDILGAIGPCISVNHFEVGEDVRDIFLREYGNSVIQTRNHKFYVDLNKTCEQDMLSAGLKPEHITDAALCTFEEQILFYSHRRDHGKTGAMAAVISLKDEG